MITIEDTDLLLENKEKFSSEVINNIITMRLRALHNCHRKQQEKQLTEHLRRINQQREIDFESNQSPVWEMAEVMQVIVPVIKGD